MENELATIWADAPDRDVVSQAANTADRAFGVDPKSDAIYLRESLWRLVVPPLRIYFTIREDDRVVEIQAIALAPQA